MVLFQGNVTNNSTNGTCHAREHQGHHMPIALTTTLLLSIAIVALLGNALVAVIIFKIRRMQTFMNWLILNLAVADLSAALFCLSVDVPMELSTKKWLFGKFLCPFLWPLRSATIFSSIFTLMALSISRFWAIAYPFKKQPSICLAKFSICFIWASSISLSIPYMTTLKYDEELGTCQESWDPSHRKLYTALTFVITYLLPLIVITSSYSQIVGEMQPRRPSVGAGLYSLNKDKQRENRKLMKLSLIITGTFAVCVLPYHVCWLVYDFSTTLVCFKYLNDLIMSSTLLLYLNSALNPINYNIFSENFREGFHELFKITVTYFRSVKKKKLGGSLGSHINDHEVIDVTRAHYKTPDEISPCLVEEANPALARV